MPRPRLSKFRNLRRRWRVLCLLLLASFLPFASATTVEIGPADNFVAVMQGLQPDDILILDGGIYTLTGYFSLSLAGSSLHPIVIEAKAGQTPVFNQTNSGQNAITILGSTFLTLDGLEITGYNRGINIMQGSDVTIRNCHLHDTTDVGISASNPGQNFARLTIVHNEIDHTGAGAGPVLGSGVYLGASTAPVHDSLVADNYIHDLGGGSNPTMDFGIVVKSGSYANTIQDNVIHDTLGPAISVADVAGNGAQNVVERNLVWNASDTGIQLEADSIARNNIVLGAPAGASGVQASGVIPPANLQIVNNTVLSTAVGIRISGAGGAVLLANNAIYAGTNAILATTSGGGTVTALANAGQGTLSGVASGFANTGNLADDFFYANLGGTPPQNLVPKGSLLPGGADSGTLANDDFYGRPRNGQADIGAYLANAGGNTGWPPRAGFKILDEIFVGEFELWQ